MNGVMFVRCLIVFLGGGLCVWREGRVVCMRVLELVNGGIRGVTAAALVKTAAQPTRLAGAAFPWLEVLWRARCALTLGSALSLLFVIYLPPTILKL